MADYSGVWDDQLIREANHLLDLQEVCLSARDMIVYDQMINDIEREIERRKGVGLWTLGSSAAEIATNC